MIENLLKPQVFKLKGRMYTFTVLQLLDANCDSLSEQLEEFIASAPRFFNNTPLVLDLNLCHGELDLKYICGCLQSFNLKPIALQSSYLEHLSLAEEHGLIMLNSSSNFDKEFEHSSLDLRSQPVKTKIHTTLVRSGQQIVSKNADLIITNSVSSGAELLADGHIHVYGTLRGRALAGISGDREARIFCQSLDAELVSIAGFYRLRDSINLHTGPCQIYLNGEHLQIELLC